MLFKWLSRLYHTIVFIIILGIFVNIFAPILVEASPIPNVFINEVHYDNDGGDINEQIEIAGEGSIDLTGWSLHLYNGYNGEKYNSFDLNKWSFIDTETNFGFLTIKTLGLQNGSPDGIVLFDGESIIQFLSYEGTFTATKGIAAGLTSIDIGSFEPSDTPLGFSLQLTGQGKQYSDFTWAMPQTNTFNRINIGQQFVSSNLGVTPVNEPNSLVLFTSFLALLLFYQNKRISPLTLSVKQSKSSLHNKDISPIIAQLTLS